MANELVTPVLEGSMNVYVLLLNSAGDMYNGSTFVTPTGTHDTFDIAASENGGGVYRANMPAVAAGIYTWEFWQRTGASPSKAADVQLATDGGFWNGTAFGVDVRGYGGAAAIASGGRPEVNVTHFGGSAGTFSSGRPEVNTSVASNQAISGVLPGSITTVTSQTEFTISSSLNFAQPGSLVVIYDTSSPGVSNLKRVVSLVDETLVVASACSFTVAIGDTIQVFPNPDVPSEILAKQNGPESVATQLQRLDEDVSSASGFNATERAQIMAALSLDEEIGVASALKWVIVRQDGQIKPRTPIVKDSEEEVEVAVSFASVLASGDAIAPEGGIVAIELLEGDVTSVAFADVDQAELWMSSAVRFFIAGGTVGETTKVRVTVLTVAGNTHSAVCEVIVRGE